MSDPRQAGTRRILTRALLLRGRLITVPLEGFEDEEGNPSVVYLKPLSAGRVMAFTKINTEDRDEVFARTIELIVETVVDADGNPLFDAESAKDIDMETYRALNTAIGVLISGQPSGMAGSAASGAGMAGSAETGKAPTQEEAATAAPSTPETPTPGGSASPTV